MYGTTLGREMGRVKEPWAENRNKAPEFKGKVEEDKPTKKNYPQTSPTPGANRCPGRSRAGLSRVRTRLGQHDSGQGQKLLE